MSLVAWVLVAALAISLPRYGPRVFPLTRLHLIVAAYLIAVGFAAIVGADSYTAAFGDEGRRLGLTFLIDMAVLYGATAASIRRRQDLIVIGVAFSLGTGVAIAYAWLQRFGLDPIQWSVNTSSSSPFGTMGNTSPFGQLLCLAFGVGLGVVVGWRKRDPRGPFLWALGLGGLSLATSAVVGNRGAFIGIIAAVGIAVVDRMRRGGLRGAFAALAVAAFAGCVLVGVLWMTPLGERLRSTIVSGTDTETRVALWHSALGAFVDRPVLGWGPDSFRIAYPAHRPLDGARIYGFIDYTADSAHNWLLQAMVTTGGLGAGVLVAMVVSFQLVLWRRGGRDHTAASALLAGGAAWWTAGLVTPGMIGVDWWPWLSFGAITALAGAEPVVAARDIPRSLAGAITSVACIVALTGYNTLDADHEMQRARRDSTATSVQAAQFAVERDSGRAEHWNELGRALFSTKHWKESGDAFAQAARRAPYDSLLWSNLALARTRQALAHDDRDGGASAAEEAARRATTVDPNSPAAQGTLTEVANALGDYDLAVAAGVRSLQLASRERSFEELVASAARRAPDRSATLAALARLPQLGSSVTFTLAAARVALDAGRWEDARAFAHQVLTLEPRNLEALGILQSVGG